MDDISHKIIFIIIFILVNGILSISRVAIYSLRKEKNGSQDWISYILEKVKTDTETFLLTIDISSTLVTILASILGGIIAVNFIKPFLLKLFPIKLVQNISELLSILLIAILLSYFFIFIRELFKKFVEVSKYKRFSIIVVVLIYYFSKIFYIFIFLLSYPFKIISPKIDNYTSLCNPKISEQDFELILEEGEKIGVIDKNEHSMITNILKFTDTTAKEIMVPRADIVGIEVGIENEKLIQLVIEEGYSRLPVYKETIDNIIGIIYTKDLLSLLEYKNLIILQDIIRPAYFVPITKNISQLLREFQQKKIHLAIVVDEFGGTEGIITMEDILEEIVGEIQDEYDEDLKEIEPLPDNSFIINARISIDKFNEKFQAEIPLHNDYTTLGGFIIKLIGKLPELNEEIKYNNLLFTIVKKTQRHIRQIRVKKI